MTSPLASRLSPCVYDCGAMTLHADGACQSCRSDEGWRRISDEGLLSNAARLHESYRAGVHMNAVDRDAVRMARGFSMLEGVDQ